VSDARRRVLVVDDEPINRRVVSRVLGRAGYDVILAADGLEALEVLERERADAVLLDLVMPRLDGVETCRRIRALQPSLPVLMLSAMSDDETRARAEAAGVDALLEKPVVGADLVARLEAALDRRAGGP
jgi:two-component system response regulator MprA